jgi:hypothetical protein
MNRPYFGQAYLRAKVLDPFWHNVVLCSDAPPPFGIPMQSGMISPYWYQTTLPPEAYNPVRQTFVMEYQYSDNTVTDATGAGGSANYVFFNVSDESISSQWIYFQLIYASKEVVFSYLIGGTDSPFSVQTVAYPGFPSGTPGSRIRMAMRITDVDICAWINGKKFSLGDVGTSGSGSTNRIPRLNAASMGSHLGQHSFGRGLMRNWRMIPQIFSDNTMTELTKFLFGAESGLYYGDPLGNTYKAGDGALYTHP